MQGMSFEERLLDTRLLSGVLGRVGELAGVCGSNVLSCNIVSTVPR